MMHCPECQTINGQDAAACTGCGLILFKLEQPKRRAEDRAAVGRRASDARRIDCPSCGSSLAPGVLRCPHCTYVVSTDFRRKIIDRRRSQINYASWVAYLGGLLLFVLFQPAGLALIGIGLVLSVLYYAIPAHIDDREIEAAGEKSGLLMRVMRQFRLERVMLPIPHVRKARLVLVGTPVLAVAVGYMANFLILQRPMNDILRGNQSFAGMSVSTHYKWWLVPGEVVYDLRNPGEGLGPLHVQAALLEFARNRASGNDEKIELQWRGETRFTIAGQDFRDVGRRYAEGDFEYALLALPRLVVPASSEKQLPTDSREALQEFHRIWYGESVDSPQSALEQPQSSPSSSS